VAAIANAIYFSDRWFEEFNPDQTQEDVFHAPVGEEKAQYMLREGDGQLYYEDDKIAGHAPEV
jgi:serine protease inhibitor